MCVMWTQDFVKCLEDSTSTHSFVDEANAIKEKHLPVRLYKYRYDNDPSRDNLRTDSVWMASPESYNDPYDSWLNLSVDMLEVLLQARLVDPFVAAAELQGVISEQDIEKAKKNIR